MAVRSELVVANVDVLRIMLPTLSLKDTNLVIAVLKLTNTLKFTVMVHL